MTLSAVISSDREAESGLSFPAGPVVLKRALGQPASWRLNVHISAEGHDAKEVTELVDLLEAGPAYIRPMWDESPLGIVGVVVGLRYEAHSHTVLRIEAHAAWPEQEEKDPYLPRRRVHKVENFQQLFDVFEPVAKTTKGVRNQFSKIKFPDESHTALIQDGWSDWAFIHHAIDQYFVLQPESEFKPLVISGSLNPSDDRQGRWLINWGSADAYETLKDKRRVDPKSLGELQQTYFAQHIGYRHPVFPTGRWPSVMHQINARVFDAADFKKWTEQDVPVFLKSSDAMVWMVEDELRDGGRPDTASWTTKLYTCPKEVSILGRQQAVGLVSPKSWRGFGEVIEHSGKGPWITVRLDGFEDGENELDVRLATAYSGTDGKKGMHFVPEEGTRVFLAWSGRFGDSVLCLGNVRQEAVDLESPSVWLEKTLLAKTADIEAQELGEITVDSEFLLSLNDASKIKGESRMELEVDGTQVKLAKGIFYTGKA